MHRAWAWGLAALVVGCGSEAPPLHAVPTCGEGLAPIPDGTGEAPCTAVGADARIADGFPDVSGAAAPIFYVQPGATGTGTREAPFGTIMQALDAGAATIALASGEHAGATIGADVRVVGAGAGSTRISGALQVMTGTATIEALALDGAGIAIAAGAGLNATDVVIDDAEIAIDCTGCTLGAQRLTIERAARFGVRMQANATATLSSLRVIDGGGVGIVAADSTLTLGRSLIADHARDGVAVLGTDGTMRTSAVTEVASLRNGVTGLRFEGAGVVGTVERCMLAGTRVPDGTVGGDGLFVGGGARVGLDASLTIESVDIAPGTQSLANARTGILSDGAATEVTVRGALLGSNGGPGLFVQSSASAPFLGYSRVEDNRGIGAGFASGARAGMVPCNVIQATRAGRMRTTTSSFEAGDGFSFADSSSLDVTLVGNEISDSARFAVVFAGVGAATMRANHGSGNRYPMVAFVPPGSVDADASNQIAAREQWDPAVTTAPTAGVSMDGASPLP